VAEILGKQNITTAADGGLSNQSVKPAEPFTIRQLMGIVHQVGIGAHQC
jgi:hypothetical protein